MSMYTRVRLFAVYGFLAAVYTFASAESHAEEYPQYSLSGSFKSLLQHSQTTFGETKNYTADLNRLKLDFDAKFSEVVRFKAVVDNEVLLGSLLDTDEFMRAKDLETNNAWDLENFIVDNEDLVWRASVYRVYLKLAFDKANVIAGRQRISWGTGRIWNPTDLFNPISPLQIERSQRVGVDALSAEYFVGKLSSINAVYAAGDGSGNDSAAVRAGTNIKGYDFSVMAGEFREDNVIGFDFGGNIGDAGFRGEATYTNPDTGSSFTRAVISVDYSWPNTFYLLLEYLYNGGNLKNSDSVSDAEAEARERFFDGQIVTRNKNFVAGGIGYELTPLVRTDGLVIVDIDDSSWFIAPKVTWNVISNLDWEFGVQLFTGDDDSEYGDNEDIYYTSIKLYF